MKRDAPKTALLGVTGAIGSGKSAVCAFLHHRFSFPVLNADHICAALLEKNGGGYDHFVAEFGAGYLDDTGNVDRRRLRSDVFADPSLRKRLEAILHPLARREMRSQADRFLAQGHPVLTEVPLLFEAGWHTDFDRIVVVYAGEGSRLARLCSRDSITSSEAQAIMECQLPVLDKIMAADHVIDNSGAWCATVAQLLHFGALYAVFP